MIDVSVQYSGGLLPDIILLTQGYFLFSFFHLTSSRWTSSLPYCMLVTKDLPISPRFTPYIFLSRCKFSTLTTRQPMVEYYLLTFPRFPLRKKDHKPYFGKNRTHDFRTSRCAGYLLDHSGDILPVGNPFKYHVVALYLFIAFVMYITTTMCDGVLHCLWFVFNVFLVSLHGD